ncbi:Cadherin member 2 [Entophlyctis sp. JEL0112]|nr:Cadherin member 2 [Entophlyctis sp. JEL0112]
MAEVGELTRLIISSYEGEYETVAPPIASIKRHGTEAPRQPQKVFHGPGTVEFHSGHKYVGNFDKGFMHGDGEFTWYDGVKYSGQFVENKIQGEGEYTWNNGSKYVGQVQNGLRSGVGHFTCGGSVSSVEYVGEWKSGKLNGKGKLIYNKSGTSYYDGDWSNGLKHGYGVMQYETGNVYEGGWVDNVKEGYGEMKWKIRGEEYRGEWKASVRNDGHGICIFENGRIFRGEFKLDKPVNDCGMFQNGLLIQTAHNWAFNFLAEHPFLFELKNLIGQDFSNCETVANHMRAVNNVILRHINDLREIYSHYSAIGPRL